MAVVAVAAALVGGCLPAEPPAPPAPAASLPSVPPGDDAAVRIVQPVSPPASPGGRPGAGAAPMRSGSAAGAPGAAATAEAVPAAVRDDVAAQRSPGAAQPELEIQAVTWSDGAIGCPQPDRMYTQALVPGWRIVVRADGREWVYHASRSGQWLLCPPGMATRPLPGDATR